jgi:AraC-like DNA-binding protein
LSLALRAVHERPAEPWSVEDLARVAGMSRAAFARRFRERLDEAPMAYVQRWRIALATRLLAEPGVSVAEVAARVGYTSEFAFNRAFKRQIGSAPGRYRRGRDG